MDCATIFELVQDENGTVVKLRDKVEWLFDSWMSYRPNNR